MSASAASPDRTATSTPPPAASNGNTGGQTDTPVAPSPAPVTHGRSPSPAAQSANVNQPDDDDAVPDNELNLGAGSGSKADAKTEAKAAEAKAAEAKAAEAKAAEAKRAADERAAREAEANRVDAQQKADLAKTAREKANALKEVAAAKRAAANAKAKSAATTTESVPLVAGADEKEVPLADLRTAAIAAEAAASAAEDEAVDAETEAARVAIFLKPATLNAEKKDDAKKPNGSSRAAEFKRTLSDSATKCDAGCRESCGRCSECTSYCVSVTKDKCAEIASVIGDGAWSTVIRPFLSGTFATWFEKPDRTYGYGQQFLLDILAYPANLVLMALEIPMALPLLYLGYQSTFLNRVLEGFRLLEFWNANPTQQDKEDGLVGQDNELSRARRFQRFASVFAGAAVGLIFATGTIYLVNSLMRMSSEEIHEGAMGNLFTQVPDISQLLDRLSMGDLDWYKSLLSIASAYVVSANAYIATKGLVLRDIGKWWENALNDAKINYLDRYRKEIASASDGKDVQPIKAAYINAFNGEKEINSEKVSVGAYNWQGADRFGQIIKALFAAPARIFQLPRHTLEDVRRTANGARISSNGFVPLPNSEPVRTRDDLVLDMPVSTYLEIVDRLKAERAPSFITQFFCRMTPVKSAAYQTEKLNKALVEAFLQDARNFCLRHPLKGPLLPEGSSPMHFTADRKWQAKLAKDVNVAGMLCFNAIVKVGSETITHGPRYELELARAYHQLTLEMLLTRDRTPAVAAVDDLKSDEAHAAAPAGASAAGAIGQSDVITVHLGGAGGKVITLPSQTPPSQAAAAVPAPLVSPDSSAPAVELGGMG